MKTEADVKSEFEREPERGEGGAAAPTLTRARIPTQIQPTEAGQSARRKRKLDAAGYTAVEAAEVESRAAA